MAAALTVRRLSRLPEGYRLRPREVRFQGQLCVEILSVGIPSAVQAIMISLSNLLVQSHINRLSVEAIAAFTAYYKVENVIYYPILAVSQACSAFVSQNIGAGKLDRAREGTRRSILLGLAVTIPLSALALGLSGPLFSLFSEESEVVALGRQIAGVTFPLYFLYVFLEVYSSSIRGAGDALPTMLITIVDLCAVRLILLEVITSRELSVTGVAAVYPLTWLVTALGMFLYYQSGRWDRSQTKRRLRLRKERV
jgi:Na+-driven multidrug efflux pump